MINYLLKAALIQVLLIVIYQLLIRNEKAPEFQRAYLLISLVTSLVVPLLSFSISKGADQVYDPVILSPVAIGAAGSIMVDKITENPIIYEYQSLLLWGYFSSVLIFLCFLANGLVKISVLSKTCTKRIDQGYVLHEIEKDGHSFSFLNKIFIRRNAPRAIINHEMAHSKLLHSIDNLLVHLYRAFFWWNPGSWILLKELRLVHEYQADDYALCFEEVSTYKKILIENSLKVTSLALVSSFHHHSILKRLKNMSNNRTLPSWKIFVTVTLVFVLGFTFSCSMEEMDLKKEPLEITTLFDTPPDFPGGWDKFQYHIAQSIIYPKSAREKKLQGHVLVEFIIDKNGNLIDPEIVRGVSPELDRAALAVFENPPTFIPGTKDGENVNTKMLIPIVFKLPGNPSVVELPKKLKRPPFK